MKNAGISEFILNGFDFFIRFKEGGMRGISFSPKGDSISGIVRKITRKLSNILNKEMEKSALGDIENQLIERRDDIFGIANNEAQSNHPNDDLEYKEKTEFIHEVTNLREHNKVVGTTYEDWQCVVKQKYENLHKVALKNFPEAWSMLEFCIAVKTIMNIEGVSLPFMGVILAAPPSLKTTVLQLFRKYPDSFYSDSFTPSSLVSHNSALTEEQLQRIDMLPKMKDKLFLTPELAPIFTAKDDDLQKTLGMITRILDGHGYENDSGAHGHRRYGDTFFVWLGAAVEIQPRVWRLLGTLGHKLYFFRPDIPEKTVDQLKELAKKNDFSTKFREVEDSLLDYLKVFDAAPELPKTIIRYNGLVKVSWNDRYSGEQDRTLYCIAQLGNLIAHLRGLVYVTEAKYTSHRNNFKDSTDKNSSHPIEVSNFPIYVQGQDYDTGHPIVEDPSRAIVLLRNLAIGYALSQGRDSLGLADIPLVMTIALSTAMIGRVKLFDLLLKHNGELTTSKITKEMRVSTPSAHRTMREFHALKIADISTVSEYGNAELKITLRQDYEWFLSHELASLKNLTIRNEESEQKHESVPPQDGQDTGENGSQTVEAKINDPMAGHTVKANSPPEGDIKNLVPLENINDIATFESFSRSRSTEVNVAYHDSTLAYDESKQQDHLGLFRAVGTESIKSSVLIEAEQKNFVTLWGSNRFNRVTESQGENQNSSHVRTTRSLVSSEILGFIKETNGVDVVLNAAVQSAHEKSELVRNYIGDKLKPRENKRLRALLVSIIRHKNIIVVKNRPQNIIRWVENVDCNGTSPFHY